ncbi:hypothetical protein DL764_002422 [Monosporascus ibericus]|uniref:Uncharacterized protein n=1 Tax=Monosporascus ibericus TaxID=155417 RepID=A0A4Q4TNT5_9PEZI|nr:hypothetical protein DL764_002422 [Monosporascus ibericus]
MASGNSLVVPAVISLILFLVSTYALIPLWRRYRSRYSQYIPLDRISDHTSTIRGRVQNALARWLVPSNWQLGARDRLVIGDDASDTGYSSDDGEELGIVPIDHRHAFSLDTRNETPDNASRLSRDLEEGFRDDSEEEGDDRRREGR